MLVSRSKNNFLDLIRGGCNFTVYPVDTVYNFDISDYDILYFMIFKCYLFPMYTKYVKISVDVFIESILRISTDPRSINFSIEITSLIDPKKIRQVLNLPLFMYPIHYSDDPKFKTRLIFLGSPYSELDKECLTNAYGTNNIIQNMENWLDESFKLPEELFRKIIQYTLITELEYDNNFYVNDEDNSENDDNTQCGYPDYSDCDWSDQ
jgi:hypothetical protein